MDESALRNCTPDALVALSRAVTTARLLSGVVHEVNNALLVLTGTVELLEARSDLPAGAARPLERLRTQSRRMAAAIAEVVAFTQAPLGRRTDVDMCEIAGGAVELRRFAATRAGLSIRFGGDGQRCPVRGNGGELQQAVLNLIVNAERDLAGTRGHIEVDARRSGAEVVVRVSETGERTPAPSDDPFEPLNLLAARAIAEAHGGALTVDESGAGTAFIVRLPALPGGPR